MQRETKEGKAQAEKKMGKMLEKEQTEQSVKVTSCESDQTATYEETLDYIDEQHSSDTSDTSSTSSWEVLSQH